MKNSDRLIDEDLADLALLLSEDRRESDRISRNQVLFLSLLLAFGFLLGFFILCGAVYEENQKLPKVIQKDNWGILLIIWACSSTVRAEDS